MKRVLYFWKIFEILIYLKELMKSFVSTKFKSMGSFQQILESLLSPPPQTRFTLKKTVSFRKLLVLWWTLPQVFIKSWFASLYLLCKFMYYFWSVISRLILLSHKSISILKVRNAWYWWAVQVDHQYQWKNQIRFLKYLFEYYFQINVTLKVIFQSK